MLASRAFLIHFYLLVLPAELLIASFVAFDTTWEAVFVAFFTTGFCSTFSTPFTTPEKNVVIPRPITAKTTTPIMIHVMRPIGRV